MPWFIAFYSFKGGVGRTLALANVAYALAARGRRVVVIDMDLEAPSLHRFPGFAGACEASAPGLLDYASEYARTGRCPPAGPHLYPVTPGVDAEALAAMRAAGGGLWLVPAGAAAPGARLDWGRLHRREGSLPFVASLKTALIEAVDPHYVLIDARTGFSDVGGLSTHVIADEVVLVFNLTRDCLAGTASAFQAMRTATRDRGSPPFALVASPVPRGSDPLVLTRLDEAAANMREAVLGGRRIVRVDYDPEMVLSDTLAVQDPERFSAAAAYERLRKRLQRDNPHEVFTVVERASILRDQGQFGAAVAEVRDFTTSHADNADGFEALGTLLLQAGRAADAAPAYREAVRIAPRIALFHRRLGEALAQTGRAEEAEAALARAAELGDDSRELALAQVRAYDALGHEGQVRDGGGGGRGGGDLIGRAMEARRRALKSLVDDLIAERPGGVPPHAREEFITLVHRSEAYPGLDAGRLWDLLLGSFSASFFEKGDIVRRIADGSLSAAQLAEAHRLLRDEESKMSRILGAAGWAHVTERIRSTSVDPREPSAMQALLRDDGGDAAVLSLYALLNGGDPTRRIALLQRAVVADPQNAEAWNLLGMFLWQQAENEGDQLRRQEELEQACAAYRAALRIRPAWAEASYNLGTALGRLAEITDRAHFAEACTRYEDAVRHKPTYHEALYNWGTTLGLMAEDAEGTQREALLESACVRFAEAAGIASDDHRVYVNWSVTLRQLAEGRSNPDRNTLLTQACERGRRAVELEPSSHHALNILGVALTRLGLNTDGASRIALLREACDRFAEARRQKPEESGTVHNWGYALSRLALAQDPPHRLALLRQAAVLLTECLRLDPSIAERYHEQAFILLHIAHELPPPERPPILAEARAACVEANRLTPGSANYNLACVASLEGAYDEAIGLLRLDQPGRIQQALADRDLAPLLAARPEFRAELQARLPPANPPI